MWSVNGRVKQLRKVGYKQLNDKLANIDWLCFFIGCNKFDEYTSRLTDKLLLANN